MIYFVVIDVILCLLFKARKHILEIHTRDWNPKLSEPFLNELSEKCVGKNQENIKDKILKIKYDKVYSVGADLKFRLNVQSVLTEIFGGKTKPKGEK